MDIVSMSKRISPLITVLKNSLYYAKRRSLFKVLSRDANTALGVNASFVVMDELLGAPDDALYNSMATSLGARKQPLMFSITTAGWSRTMTRHPCYLILGAFPCSKDRANRNYKQVS